MFIELPAFRSSHSLDRPVSILAATLYGLGPTLPRPPRTHARPRPILSFCTHAACERAKPLGLANLRSASYCMQRENEFALEPLRPLELSETSTLIQPVTLSRCSPSQIREMVVRVQRKRSPNWSHHRNCRRL